MGREKIESDEGGVQHPEVKADKLKDGGLLDNRKCTDCCMILFATVFVLLWIVVAAVAFALGKPNRILLPENFREELCGDEGAPLENYQYLYIPKPSRLSYGICVPDHCPYVGDYICNNDIEPSFEDPSVEVRNHVYNHNATEYLLGQAAFSECLTNSSCVNTTKAVADRFLGMLKRQAEYKCFFVFYTTGSTLNRCLPFQSDRDNQTLADLAGESKDTVAQVADKLGVGAFFTRGFGEVSQSWLVLIICGITACVISIIWIALLQCLIGPIVYLCIILIFVALCAIGYFAMTMADDLENVKLPGDTATDDQVKMWRAVQYSFWILAGIYFVVMVWMLKRIRIAIIIMEQGSKAFLDNKLLIIVPPIVFLLVCAWIVWFIYVTLYIQTIGKVDEQSFKDAANNTFGATAYDAVVSAVNATNNTFNDLNVTTNTTINTSTWTTETYVKIMHAYNFFGFLWAANFCIMFGFFVMAMTTCTWYFSATFDELKDLDEGKETGRKKETPVGTMPKSFCNALTKHLGTVLWGSLLIAIIQFVRVLFLYLEEEFLSRWKESATVKIIIYCVNCCLAYIERVVKIISKNAFIICCINNTSFCTSAGEALGLLVSNAVRVGALSMMSSIAFFLVKLFIVVCNCVIAYFLIRTESLTENKKVESGLFPLLFIFVMTFIIASLFVSVLESCTDTVMMCFLWDEEHLAKRKEGTFMPPDLVKLCDAFGEVEQARRDYEARLAAASKNKKNPESNEPK